MPDREASFKTKEGRPFFVRPGGTNDHQVLHFDGSASDMRIDRLSRMPAVCGHLTPDTPRTTSKCLQEPGPSNTFRSILSM